MSSYDVSGDINEYDAGAAGCFEQLNLNSQAQSVCVGVDTQSLLVATTSDIGRRRVKNCLKVVVALHSVLLQQLLGCWRRFCS
jgi:hypothetical protein